MPGAVKGLSLGWAWVRSWAGPGQRKKYVGEGVNFPAELPRPRLGPCPLKSQRCCCLSREGVLKPLLPLRRAQWSSRLAVESCSSLDETGTLNNSRLEMFQNPPGFPVSRYHDITRDASGYPSSTSKHPTSHHTRFTLHASRRPWVGANAGLGFENVQTKSILGENQEASPAEHKPPARRRPFSGEKRHSPAEKPFAAASHTPAKNHSMLKVKSSPAEKQLKQEAEPGSGSRGKHDTQRKLSPGRRDQPDPGAPAPTNSRLEQAAPRKGPLSSGHCSTGSSSADKEAVLAKCPDGQTTKSHIPAESETLAPEQSRLCTRSPPVCPRVD